jgi:hypothetical protein
LGYTKRLFLSIYCKCTGLHTSCLKHGEDLLVLIFMMIFHNAPPVQLAVGKYLVSPLAKPQGEGRYVASVSIRSGKGSATHDRVMRFSGLFDTAASALHYATEHALGWIKERSAPACA